MLTFVHEIVHLSQNLADQINSKSSAEYGGIQGCIVEREYIRLMGDFMGEKVEGYPLSETTESAARKAISEKAKTRRKRE